MTRDPKFGCPKHGPDCDWNLTDHPLPNHQHTATPRRPGDPKTCACGLRRDPVTHAWMTVEAHAQLAAERQQRRARFGATRPEGEALARAMNGAGL